MPHKNANRSVRFGGCRSTGRGGPKVGAGVPAPTTIHVGAAVGAAHIISAERRACPVCGGVFPVRKDGGILRHKIFNKAQGRRFGYPCPGDDTGTLS